MMNSVQSLKGRTQNPTYISFLTVGSMKRVVEERYRLGVHPLPQRGKTVISIHIPQAGADLETFLSESFEECSLCRGERGMAGF